MNTRIAGALRPPPTTAPCTSAACRFRLRPPRAWQPANQRTMPARPRRARQATRSEPCSGWPGQGSNISRFERSRRGRCDHISTEPGGVRSASKKLPERLHSAYPLCERLQANPRGGACIIVALTPESRQFVRLRDRFAADPEPQSEASDSAPGHLPDRRSGRRDRSTACHAGGSCHLYGELPLLLVLSME